MFNSSRNILHRIKRKIVGEAPNIARAHQACEDGLPKDFDEFTRSIIQSVSGYTMTSPERIAETIQATRHISKNDVRGDIVECGVWKGGSVLAIISTLLELRDTTRRIFLFDTFDGMTEPDDRDISIAGIDAKELLAREDPSIAHSVWCKSPLESVKAVIEQTRYPKDLIHFVEGRVEDTIPRSAPTEIGLLRLDTDWYTSTAHELKHLYPRVTRNGIIIIDDYGHWQGARQAVDEYISHLKVKPFLARTDYTGRICSKPD